MQCPECKVKAVEQIRLMLMHSGYTMEKYISFSSRILDTIESLEGSATENFDQISKDITKMVDTIIKKALEQSSRAFLCGIRDSNPHGLLH